jgi:hypothetical protein
MDRELGIQTERWTNKDVRKDREKNEHSSFTNFT